MCTVCSYTCAQDGRTKARTSHFAVRTTFVRPRLRACRTTASTPSRLAVRTTFRRGSVQTWFRSDVVPFTRGSVQTWFRSDVGPFRRGSVQTWVRSDVVPFRRGSVQTWVRSDANATVYDLRSNRANRTPLIYFDISSLVKPVAVAGKRPLECTLFVTREEKS